MEYPIDRLDARKKRDGVQQKKTHNLGAGSYICESSMQTDLKNIGEAFQPLVAEDLVNQLIDVGRIDTTLRIVTSCDQCAVRATTFFEWQNSVVTVPLRLFLPSLFVSAISQHPEMFPELRLSRVIILDCEVGELVL